MIPASIRCDIFCAVIDNIGDAGVSWQLAQHLADEPGWRVRLWIDDPAPIVLLAPDQESIEVLRWTGDFAVVEPDDVVVEAVTLIHCIGASQRPDFNGKPTLEISIARNPFRMPMVGINSLL